MRVREAWSCRSSAHMEATGNEFGAAAGDVKSSLEGTSGVLVWKVNCCILVLTVFGVLVV